MSNKFDATRVIIVDDDELIREGLTQILRGDSTIEVVGEATNGQDAVSLASRVRPDVVVMDLSMPKLDGVATTRQMIELLPETAVLAISVYTDMDRAREVIDAGAMGYVVKAGAPRYLVPAVHALANGNVFFSPGIAQRLMERLQTPRLASNDA